jgi:hypothetical protein
MVSSVTDTITTGGQTLSIFGDFNIKLFGYIVIALLIEIIAIVYGLKVPMFLALALFVPLSLYIFLVYGFQWFGPDGPFSNKRVVWPPTLNSCPDFLISYPVTITVNNKATMLPGCIDTIGVSTKPGSFPRATAGTPVNFTAPTTPVTAATAASYLSNGWFATKTGETTGALCARLQTAGLTWEGVWDGNTCYSAGSAVPTNPASSTDANCPSGV